jgi:hypothetical protein
MLAVSEYDLWPDSRHRDRLGELIGAYPQRQDPHAPDWQALLRAARHHIDMLGYTLGEVLGTPGVGELLAAKAADGVKVRIAIADSDGQQAALSDLEHRPAGQLLRRIRQSQERLAPLADRPGIQVRTHHACTTHTILRFDEQLLLTLHLYGTPGFQAPLLHLHRRRDYGIFDRLAKHLEDIWHDATPLDADGDEDAIPTTATDLDDLDYTWRPER